MNNKDKYGEVLTPPFFIEQMFDDLKKHATQHDLSSSRVILEPGSGKGAFFQVFQNENKMFVKPDFKYILNEINHEHTTALQKVVSNYPSNTELLITDVFQIDTSRYHNNIDMIVGNLPFNCNTKKFVPALSVNNKNNKHITQSKSITIWNKIVQFCFKHLLKPGGYFYAIIPCIWLKPDRGEIYDLFTRDNSIILLKTFNSQHANRVFNYNCQTPICYVLVKKQDDTENKKTNRDNQTRYFKLYDHSKETYLNFRLNMGNCIPTSWVDHFITHSQFMNERQISSCYEHVLKISTLDPKCLSGEIVRYTKGGLENHSHDICNPKQTYKIITGSLYNKKTKSLTLNGFVSTRPCLYYGHPKLILPHKRLAKFYKDYDGTYSCFGRDMFVFLCEDERQIDELYDFFTYNHVVNNMIESGFTIRMNFIEKYVFQYIPWIFDKKFNYENYYTQTGEE